VIPATEKVAACVRDNSPAALCPTCLRKRIHLDTDTIEIAFAEVALQPGYSVDRKRCSDCQKDDFVLAFRSRTQPN
jgi:hypothetical protein